MDHTQELVARIKALAERQGISPSTLSTKLLGNGLRLAQIEAGGSLTMATYTRALAQLDELERAA